MIKKCKEVFQINLSAASSYDGEFAMIGKVADNKNRKDSIMMGLMDDNSYNLLTKDVIFL